MNKIFFIAEIGINHNGSIEIAKKLIDNAVEARFDAVKFQKRTIDIVYSKELLDSPRESPWGNTQRQQKMGIEFGLEEYREIDSYSKYKKIEWFASAWDLKSLEFLDQFDLKYQKVASAMIVDQTFLKAVALRGKHTFISTGMATLDQIKKAVEIFSKSNCSFELMHCVSEYPAPVNILNLNTITELKKIFKCNVGYSGHENGLAASFAAASLGISSLERHITLDRTMYGSDQAASIEKRGMIELVNVIEKMLSAYGDSKVGYITENEFKIAEKLRAHLPLK